MELLRPLILKGATFSELPQSKNLGIPKGQPLTKPELELLIDASMGSKSSPKDLVISRIADKIKSGTR